MIHKGYIPEFRLEKLQKELTRVNNKIRRNKYNGTPLSLVCTGEEEYRTYSYDDFTDYTVKWIEIEVTGEPVNIPDWKIVGIVEYVEGYKQNIVYNLTEDINLIKYSDTPLYCDHCNTNRYRTLTFLLQNKNTKEIKQVGKTCVNDYTGIDIEKYILSIANFFGFIKSYCSEEDDILINISSQPLYTNTKEYTSDAVELILKKGFQSAKKFGYADSTCSKLDSLLQLRRTGKKSENRFWTLELLDETEKGKIVTEYIFNEYLEMLNNKKATDIINDFENNFLTVLKAEYFLEDHKPLMVAGIAYAIKTYNDKYNENNEEKEKQVSEYQGKVKDKIELELTIQFITGWESQWSWTNLYKMVDDKGNVYVWKTANWLYTVVDPDTDYTNYIPVVAGDKVKVKGTVKEHTMYGEEKQTVLTRVKQIL